MNRPLYTKSKDLKEAQNKVKMLNDTSPMFCPLINGECKKEKCISYKASWTTMTEPFYVYDEMCNNPNIIGIICIES